MDEELKGGYCFISRIVIDEVKTFFDNSVQKNKFVSRNQAIRSALIESMYYYSKMQDDASEAWKHA